MMQVEITGLTCWKCAALGHMCPAQTKDADEKPLCVFCADGDQCPVQKRAPLRPAISSLPRKARGKARRPQPSNEDTTVKERTFKVCPAIGCGKEYTPTGNRQVFCSPECKQRERVASKPTKLPNYRLGRPRKDLVAKPKAVASVPVVAAPDVHTFAIHKRFIDSLLLALPTDRKIELLRSELAAAE
jgi:hypothetical protein